MNRSYQIVRRTRLKVFAFDVDHTLEISEGPVTLQSMMDLRNEGAIVGLCGNWACFCQRVQGWQHLISFMNVGTPNKETHLMQLKMYIPADEFVLVGNRFGRKNSLGIECGSDDEGVAAKVGWRFILEDDFAKGVR